MRFERVLIVDDEAPARNRLRKLLESREAADSIEECSNGLAALKKLEESSPDLLLLDIQMPEMGGIELARKFPAEILANVIFVTAYDEHAVQAFELNAVDYLLKPFRDERFFEALERARIRSTKQTVASIHRTLSILSDSVGEREQTPRIENIENGLQ